jgi:hypothetical protein
VSVVTDNSLFKADRPKRSVRRGSNYLCLMERNPIALSPGKFLVVRSLKFPRRSVSARCIGHRLRLEASFEKINNCAFADPWAPMRLAGISGIARSGLCDGQGKSLLSANTICPWRKSCVALQTLSKHRRMEAGRRVR